MSAPGTDAPRAPGLPDDLARNPRLSRWVSVDPDGAVTIRVGKVELGQGIATALAQIAAEELSVHPRRLRVAAASTPDAPDEGVTAGSRSIQDCGAALRQACAEVRAVLVRAAAARFGDERLGEAGHDEAGHDEASRVGQPGDDAPEPPDADIRDGEVFSADGSTSVSYWELTRADRGLLDTDATGLAAPVSAETRALVAENVPRLDLPDKVAGRPRFVHDLRLPGQLCGRVVRPPSRAATLVEVDTRTARESPGVVAVVRDGAFLGVVADSEGDAVAAADALRRAARWEEPATLPEAADLPAHLRAQRVDTEVIEERGAPVERTADGPAAAHPDARTRSADYSRPFIAHASIGPGCAIARWEPDDGGDGAQLAVWTHSQGIFRLREAIARVVGLDVDRVVVRHAEGAGSYGHNSADDVALDAVLLARAVPGRPVQVVWSREDELSWAPLGSAMAVRLSAGLDDSGRVVQWRQDVWSYGHVARPGYAGTPSLLAATHLAEPFSEVPSGDGPPTGSMGSSRNAVPLYDFPDVAVARHRPVSMPLRTSALRSLGAFCNVYAIESFMDELAEAAGADPVEYRLAHLYDPRARAVLVAAAGRAGWPERDHADGRGFGVAFARYKNASGYCAVVAEVEADYDVRVRRLTAAVDVGRVVSPDGLVNQIEGGAIQSTSWTLKEAVRFDRTRVTSTSWETYPILRFSEVPAVDVEILSRPEEPSLGAGEIAQGPTAGAIGNAVAEALGLRIRDLPITRERIIAAIDA